MHKKAHEKIEKQGAKRMIFDEMGQKISAEKSHLSSVIKERWKIDEESIPGKRDHTAV